MQGSCFSAYFKRSNNEMVKTTKAMIAGLIFGLAFGAVAFAQQTSPQTQAPTPGVQRRQGFGQMGRRRAMRRRAMKGGFGVLRQLNLTDAQKQQARTIMQSNRSNTSTKASREELAKLRRQWRDGTLTPEGMARAKELRKQFHESRQGVRNQLAGILTPEQKAKLEEMIKTRRANHEKFGPRRQMPNKPL
jgi:Spy/CpxP family protein refolding chaperone